MVEKSAAVNVHDKTAAATPTTGLASTHVATTDAGMDEWLAWIERGAASARAAAPRAALPA